MKIELPATRHATAQDSTWRPAVLVAWLVVERNRLLLEVEALRVKNERLRLHAPQPQSVFDECYLAPHSPTERVRSAE